MKANGLMAIAFLFSATAFAQQASVKTTVNANVNSQASAGNSSVGAGSTVAGSSTVRATPVTINSTTTGSNAVQVGRTSAENAGNIAVRQTAAGTMVIENTIKPATSINAAVSHAGNVPLAPLRMNTRITGGAILGIL